jgi:hypothetical protein
LKNFGIVKHIREPAGRWGLIDAYIAMFVAIGKGTTEAWPRPGQLYLNDVVIKNSFA